VLNTTAEVLNTQYLSRRTKHCAYKKVGQKVFVLTTEFHLDSLLGYSVVRVHSYSTHDSDDKYMFIKYISLRP